MKSISETRRLQCNKRNLEKIQLPKISLNRNKMNRFRTQSKTNRLIWRRMEEQNRESPEERNRREELYRVIEKIRNTPVQNNEEQQVASRQVTTIEPEAQSEETMLNGSNDSLDVPVKNSRNT